MTATLSDVYKSKDTEILFKQENFDTKKKLNRSDKVISERMLGAIENGITSEMLDSFKVPIFKYGTQITIHGLFPDLAGTISPIGGYKRIFQNKNKSLGVKYEAIDFEKKTQIYNAFQHQLQFRIEHNSREYCAYKMIEVKSKEEALAKKAEYEPIMNKINIKFGRKQMYFTTVNYWGVIKLYLVLTIHINAIYDADIPKFYLDSFGRSREEIHNEIDQQKKERNAERDRENKEREQKRTLEKESEQKLLAEERNKLFDLGYKITENRPIVEGLLLFNVTVNTCYSTGEQYLEYKLSLFYKQARAKLFQVSTRSFSTIDELLNNIYTISTSYCDAKFRKNTINGYILKSK